MRGSEGRRGRERGDWGGGGAGGGGLGRWGGRRGSGGRVGGGAVVVSGRLVHGLHRTEEYRYWEE